MDKKEKTKKQKNKFDKNKLLTAIIAIIMILAMVLSVAATLIYNLFN